MNVKNWNLPYQISVVEKILGFLSDFPAEKSGFYREIGGSCKNAHYFSYLKDNLLSVMSFLSGRPCFGWRCLLDQCLYGILSLRFFFRFWSPTERASRWDVKYEKLIKLIITFCWETFWGIFTRLRKIKLFSLIGENW